jgi:hypothetical protein
MEPLRDQLGLLVVEVGMSKVSFNSCRTAVVGLGEVRVELKLCVSSLSWTINGWVTLSLFKGGVCESRVNIGFSACYLFC